MFDKFVRSAQDDADVIQRRIMGEDITNFPLWRYDKETKSSILTYAGAHQVAKDYQMTAELVTTNESLMNLDGFRKPVYQAIVRVYWGNRSITGASNSQDPAVARGLAFRNAVNHFAETIKKGI